MFEQERIPAGCVVQAKRHEPRKGTTEGYINGLGHVDTIALPVRIQRQMTPVCTKCDNCAAEYYNTVQKQNTITFSQLYFSSALLFRIGHTVQATKKRCCTKSILDSELKSYLKGEVLST